jgi:hypothetical protein
LGATVRIGLTVGIFVLGALGVCTSTVKATQPAPESIPEMAKYTVNVGKDYWVHDNIFRLCAGATNMRCGQLVPVGTHFKIDGLVPNQASDGRPIFDPYYHLTLDDGRTGYLSVQMLFTATDIDPAAAAAECKQRGQPRIGMTVKQLEATCWGKPGHINRRETAKGIRDQYVYSNGRYVDLHNGIVTAIDISGGYEKRAR